MAHVLAGWLLRKKCKCPAGFQHALLDFGERLEALLPGSCFELRHGNQLPLQILHSHFTAQHQNVGSAFDQLVEFAVIVEEANDQIVGDEQGSSADDSAQDAVVFAYDGVLHSVRERQQDDQIEWIELDEFAFPGEPEANYQENINDDRPQNLFRQGSPMTNISFQVSCITGMPPRCPRGLGKRRAFSQPENRGSVTRMEWQ